MEKKIVLRMNEDGAIVISVNAEDMITIHPAKREISADELYSTISYSRGDCYSVEMINDVGKDTNVMEYFKLLFDEITSKLNNMSITEKQQEESTEEELPF